ncbi:MAG: hypothetical protein J0I34_06570 [Pseudonocardia sp.]|uniref:hypothetical protein n=1 Tax=unclassified Pseudonocardia TaxID=2619320 RepID=UPI00086D9893|nr:MULTISPECIES: hypothetical protein [unclassified Pseudonocardia]MBN9108428.1 hypothetical protein [Pseudonocardia sp.]ODU05274.1 MAG: hypothetical protein ABS80_25170 [Pseudonocardia sp. SCN 72-51]ODV08793.1 MAG: hypothetical protein ABT15_03035 [Pseudonocardia sp. SCN 73-27]
MSLAEVKAVVADVAEQTRTAAELVRRAGDGVAEAVRILADLSRQHSESLVPSTLTRAADELDRCHDHVAGALQAVGDLDARL